jgi:hypothetical protein
MMYMFDVETLGVESTTVILSAAIIKFDPTDTTLSYDDYISEALFVKFDVQEQVNKYKRTIDKSTIEWWSKQHDYVRKVSFHPSEEDDLTAIEGIKRIADYIDTPYNENTMWSRGSLDQMSIDSLCKVSGQELIAPYNNWRDIRTALDCLTETSKNGYCDLKIPFDRGSHVIKHHPTHDCAYDIMMLIHGK